MSDFNINDIGSLEVAVSQAWEPIPAGTYTFEVDEAEWTESKAGNDMIVVTFICRDEGHEGARFISRTVLTYVDKKTGVRKIHWDIPTLAHAAGGEKLFPADPAKRKAALKDGEAWMAKVAKGLVGKKAQLTIEVEAGRSYIDSNGEEREGNPQNVLKKMVFEAPAKTSASSITL